MTIWNTSNGSFNAKIDIETRNKIHFTQNSLFVSSPVFEHKMENNKVKKISNGGNCIFEVGLLGFYTFTSIEYLNSKSCKLFKEKTFDIKCVKIFFNVILLLPRILTSQY